MKRMVRGLVIGVGAAVGAAVGGAYALLRPAEPVPATVVDDPTLPRLEVGGRLLHAEVFGSEAAPVVIVVHGGPGMDYASLRPLGPALADRYRVVLYDQAGAGLSERVPDAELTMDRVLAELHALGRKLSPDRPVALVGHSWGGMVAAHYLARHPDRVARAVLAEPGVLTTPALRALVEQMQPAMDLGTLALIARAVIEAAHIDGPDSDAVADYVTKRVMQAPGDANPMSGYWCDGIPPDAALATRRVGARAMSQILEATRGEDGELHMPKLDASRYAGEVLVLAGACNQLIGPERQREHVGLFPSARLKVIEGAGHLMLVEKPKESLAVIRSYLSQGPPPFGPER